MLAEVARRLAGCLGDRGLLYRVGGDEFAVLTDYQGEAGLAIRLGEEFVRVVGQFLRVAGIDFSIGLSVGVALSTISGSASELLFRDAEIALERAKGAGGRRCHLLDAVERAALGAQLDLEADLRTAIDTGRVDVAYQPIVTLAGRAVGVEALARWRHPVRGRVAAADFIEAAERSSLILGLGRGVLSTATRHVAAWRREQAPDLTLSVNLSARQLTEPSLCDFVLATIEESGLPPGALCFELTETALLDDPIRAEASLTALHNRGIRIAVDDFGVGYSSLLYLRTFPVDELKLDRHFVAGLGRDPTDALIIGSVIELAHSLGLTTVAEGIETVEQLDVLRRLGCDLGQGYYFSRPCQGAKLRRLLNRTLPDGGAISDRPSCP